MSVYRGVCARLNGKPDSQGDVLSKNVHIPRNPVKVTHNFYENTLIGSAYLEIEGDEVIAYVRFYDPEVHCKEVVEQMYAVVGGSIVDRKGDTVNEWIIKEISITPNPCDTTLTKLKLNPRNGCCEYHGPPFYHCEKCGGRKSR